MNGLTQPALPAAQSRLAYQAATCLREQTRHLVAASQQRCAASRQAMASSYRATPARAQVGQPGEQRPVSPTQPAARADRPDRVGQ